MRRAASIVMMCAATAGCGESVPDNPTWGQDVQPILAANCVKCHISPPLDGAPGFFRLDRYETTLNDDGIQASGAQGYAQTIAIRVAAEEDYMPPRFPLTERQIDTLVLWSELGAPDGAKAGNSNPTIEPTLDPANVDADGFLTIPYFIDDDDFDIVFGQLEAVGATTELITRELHSGNGEAIWDVGAVAEGSYDLVATLDDGSVEITQMLGSFTVVHADGNTAPTITFVFPVPDVMFNSPITIDRATDGDVVTVELDIADPDAADTLTMSVEAFFRRDQVIPIAADVAVANTVTWDTAGLPSKALGNELDFLEYRLRVTVSDGTATRTKLSAPFFLGESP